MRHAAWPIVAITGLVVGFGLGWKSGKPEALLFNPPDGQIGRTTVAEEEKRDSEVAAPPPVSPDAPKVRSEKPSSPGWAPKKQFVRLAFDRWPKEQRHVFLWELFIHNPAAKRQLFDFLMSTSDSGAWEAGQDYLIASNDKDLVKSIAEAFDRETNPSRKAMLAYGLAGNTNHPVTHAGLQEALETNDEKLLKRTLTRLNLGTLDDFPDTYQRVESRLRSVVGSGMSEEVRVAAIRSLRGGDSEGTIRYLLDLALRDPSAAIQGAAIGSLPITSRSHPPLLKEHLDLFWLVVRDPSRDARVRKNAAYYLRDQSRFNRMPLNDADRAMLDSILEKRD